MKDYDKLITVTCPRCEGEGGWEQMTHLSYSGDIWAKLCTCPMCEGRGEIEVYVKSTEGAHNERNNIQRKK